MKASDIFLNYSTHNSLTKIKIGKIELQSFPPIKNIHLSFVKSTKDTIPFIAIVKGDKTSPPLSIQGSIEPQRKILKIGFKQHGLSKQWQKLLDFLPINLKNLKSATMLKIQFINRKKIAWDLRFGTNQLRLKKEVALLGKFGPVPTIIKTNGFFFPQRKQLLVKKSSLQFKSTTSNTLNLNFEAHGKNIFHKDQEWTTSIQIPRTLCAQAFSWIPRKARKFALKELRGKFSTRISFRFNPTNLQSFEYRVHNIHHSCKLSQKGAQTLRAKIEKIQNNPNFLTSKNVSPSLFQAIVSSEDSGFWHHKGIAPLSMIAALRENLKEKKVIMGGSTITMQVVKNLFFSPKRTLFRKIQEVFLALELEKIATKTKILELYSNIAEFYPGKRGIQHAAKVFFDKTAAELELHEAIQLSLGLPNPKALLQIHCNNQQPPWFKARYQRVLDAIKSQTYLGASPQLKPLVNPNPYLRQKCLEPIAKLNTLLPL